MYIIPIPDMKYIIDILCCILDNIAFWKELSHDMDSFSLNNIVIYTNRA